MRLTLGRENLEAPYLLGGGWERSSHRGTSKAEYPLTIRRSGCWKVQLRRGSSVVGGAGGGEKLRKIKWTNGIEALEDNLDEMEFSS